MCQFVQSAKVFEITQIQAAFEMIQMQRQLLLNYSNINANCLNKIQMQMPTCFKLFKCKYKILYSKAKFQGVHIGIYGISR